MTLSEVMFDPDGTEATAEFIELYNESIFARNLSGWQITDGVDTDAVIAWQHGTMALPHQYVLILDPDYLNEQSSVYDSLIPADALVLTINNSTFGERGLPNDQPHTISLLDGQGRVQSVYTYSIGNDAGYSDEKVLPQSGDSSAVWRNSLVLRGTPGFRNSVTPPDRDFAVTVLAATPVAPQMGDSFSVSIRVQNVGRFAAADSLYLCLADEFDSLETLRSWSTGTVQSGDTASFAHRLRMASNIPLKLVANLSGSDEVAANDRRTLIVSANGEPRAMVINEILYNPEPQRSEWVELANPGPLSWNLSGWWFGDGTSIADTSRRFLLPDVTIAPQQFAVLAADSSILFENIPPTVPVIIWNTSHITLNNTGDSLLLYSVDGQVIDRVDYRPSWGNGVAGTSIERISLQAASTDPLNWAPCLDSTGSTPGAVNSRTIPAGRTSVELLTLEPNPFSPDGDGRNDMLRVRYQLKEADSRLDLKIYDVRGRLIRRLANNESAGYAGEKLWDGRDDNGRVMPTGLYIIYLEALGKGGTRIQTTRRSVALARRS